MARLSLSARLSAFRFLAVAEAVSWVGLLTGMYVKYVPETTEAGVEFFGPVHGVLFLAYLLALVLLWRPLRWSMSVVALGLVSAVVPLATVWFERWAARTGRLAVPAVPRENMGAASGRTQP
jgi:integral membrane protein